MRESIKLKALKVNYELSCAIAKSDYKLAEQLKKELNELIGLLLQPANKKELVK